jgi:asparagine synthase (glutamine-hydrolysing)
MCGIFGAIAKTGRFDRADRERFCALTQLVQHRGPNDSGCLVLNVAHSADPDEEKFDVFVGHRRLSILDLSAAGHQPMTDGRGRWIVFNGEIFNYLELRAELEAKGHTFRSGTDTEVILHIHAEYGESGFDKLNGMWAFALVDVPGCRVILSRDRFSIKPLYLLSTAGALYFASEITQLLPLLSQRELNLEVMSAFLLQGLVDHTHDTFFRGITRLPPKTNLVICVNTGQVREERYWEFAPENPVPARDAEEAFRELLLDSIRIRLRSDVKVGVLLSGGLDSSAIAVATQQLSDVNIDTYSIISNREKYSEERFIDELAGQGIHNLKIAFTSPDVLKDLEKVVQYHGEPFGGFSVLAQHKLFQAIKQQGDATVLLSGQGGDEVLLGYLKFFFFYIRCLVRERRYYRAMAELVQSLLRRTAMAQLSLAQARRYSKRYQGTASRMLVPRHVAEPIWNCANLRSRQISEIDRYSVPALARYEDRNSMAYSLEVRHPLLDHRLVNFLVNLPPELKIHEGWTKHILRKSLPGIPAAIRWRKDKQPFITPEESWLKKELAGVIKAQFRKSRLGELGVLKDNEFLNRYERFRRGGAIPPTEISRVVIAEAWARRFFGAS